MASDEKLKACPFCGEAPMDDETGLYCVSCGNSDCVIADRWMSATAWNRRAPVPGAVRKYVDIDGWNLMNDGTLRHCAMWSERLREDDIPVEVRPVEEGP